MIKNLNIQLTRTLFSTFLLLGTFSIFAQPANDDPCNAIHLDLNTSCISSNHTNNLATATTGVTAPGCANYLGGDVWFSFTMPNNGFHGLVEMGAAGITDGGMAVYSGTDCNSLTLISCDDNGGTGLMPSITVDDGCSFELAGATIWIRVWENGNDNNGTFDICAQAITPPVPGTATGCAPNAPASNTCCDAVILNESLDGYCGNTGGYTDNPDEISGFCAFIDNNSWIAFEATETSIALDFTSFNCTGAKGIQVDIFESSDCTNFNSVSDGCFNIGSEGTGTLSATGLTVGNIYYIMVDGWAGDICDYSISVTGIDPVEVTASDDDICQGESVQLQASIIGVGPYTYSWSPAGSLNDATIANPIATPSTTTTYTLTISGGNLSTNVFTIPITVHPAAPTSPTISGAATICENATGISYNGTAAGATDYLWTVTGGATIMGSNTDPTVSIDWGTTGGDVCLVVSNGCGTSPQNCYTVTVGNRPDISATDPATICAPNTIDLATDVTVTDANSIPGTFSYYADQTAAEAGAPTLPSSVVSSSGTYWIRKESGAGCYDVTSVTVTIEDPNLLVDDSALITCEPGSLNLAFASITETTGLFGTKTFYANSADAISGNNALGSTTVSIGGTYWVRFQTASGCFAVAPITATIEAKPDITIVQPAPICEGADLDLATVAYTDANSTTITNTYFFATQVIADLGIPSFAMSSSVVGVGCYYIRVETASGCFDTAEICVTESTPPTASISGGGAVCSGESIDLNFSLTGNGPFNVVYSDGTNQTLTGISDGHIETITLSSNTDFSLVSVEDAGGCSGTVSTNIVSGTVSTAPTATISGTATICTGSSTDLVFNFTGTGPFDIELLEDGNPTTLTGLVDGDTYTVTPSADTDYTIGTITDANACTATGSGLATITVVNAPQIINVVEDCDLATASYTVSFEITGGDPASYVVAPLTGTLTGNSFVSDPIASGQTYSFDVSDSNNCGTDNTTGSVSCSCSTDAGTMDLNLIEHCENELGIAMHNNDENLNPGDILLYALHDAGGSDLGIVYNIGAVPEFSIETGMSYGSIYYISAIAGPDNGMGMIDTTHACFSVAPGTPVIFHQLPMATISGDATICSGAQTDLVINFTQGTGPFDVVVSDGVNAPISLDDISDGHILSVTATTNSVFTITSVLDNTVANCIGSAMGSATIDILSSPTASMMDFHCNATNTAYQVSFVITGGDPASYTVTGGPGNLDNMAGTFTSDWINSGTGFNFTLNDNNNCSPATVSGNFACNCGSFAGAMGTNMITLCEDQTIVGIHDSNENLDGDDALGFVLHDDPGITLGNVLMTNTAPAFDFNDVDLDYGVTYYISAVVANDDGTGFPVLDSNLDPCISVAPGQPISFEQIPQASLLGDATICEGDSVLIMFSIVGTGPFNVEYTDNTNNYILTDIEDGHTIRVSPETLTNYTLVNIANAYGSSCMGTIHPLDFEATIDVISVPKVNNLSIDCNVAGTEFTVSFDIIDGNPAAYTVEGDPGNLTGSSFVSNTYPTGSTYYFRVHDATTCDTIILTSTEYCNCTPDIRPDISIVETISCNGETDGVLKVDNVNGQAPFEFDWSNAVEGNLNSNLGTGWYFVTMTDGNNCSSVDSIFLAEPSPISASLAAEGVSCYGDTNGAITFENVQGGAGGYSFSLNNTLTSTNPGFYGLSAGTYTGTIVDAAGCGWEMETLVEEPSELVVNFGEDIHLQLGDSVQIQAFVNQVVDTFYWETIGELSCTDCLTPFVKPINSTPYEITVISPEGCVDSDVIWVHLNKERPVFIPTAFSPNGDGSNDMFMIYGGVGIVEVSNMSIFNRWGELVYKAEKFQPGDESYGWDGSFKSKELNTGVYVYYVEIVFEDGTTELFRGDVTLMR